MLSLGTEILSRTVPQSTTSQDKSGGNCDLKQLTNIENLRK